MNESANFVLVASTLLLIKSKSLLPNLELSEEEQGSVEDLERRLKEYQRFKVLAQKIKSSWARGMLFPREYSFRFAPVFSPDEKTNSSELLMAVKRVLAQIPRVEKLSEITIKKVANLEEMITKLSERISSSLKTSFKDFLGNSKAERTSIIVGFLALLELVKRGTIIANQDSSKGDILLESATVGVPKYSET